jgi:hypothetical protein
MEPGVENDLIATWRWVAAILIGPVTVIPGLHAIVLVISSFCVLLDSWSLEGAMTNLSLGFPAVAGITALWISTLLPFSIIARRRLPFVLVTTGLLSGFALECLLLKAGLVRVLIRLPVVDLLQVWMFTGPLALGLMNLVFLIRARDAIYKQPARVLAAESTAPVRVSGIPPHHLQPEPVLRPFILRPYRPPISLRTQARRPRAD